MPLASGVTGSTYNTVTALTPNSVYKFKVESRNAFGFSSIASNEVSIRAASIADAPTNLANNVIVTAKGVIGLTWSAGASNGGSPIVDYRVNFHTGSNAFVVLSTGITQTSFTATGLVAD